MCGQRPGHPTKNLDDDIRRELWERQFAPQRAAVEAAGYQAGEGFIRLPYDRELPTALLEGLVAARLAEFEATGAGW